METVPSQPQQYWQLSVKGSGSSQAITMFVLVIERGLIRTRLSSLFPPLPFSVIITATLFNLSPSYINILHCSFYLSPVLILTFSWAAWTVYALQRAARSMAGLLAAWRDYKSSTSTARPLGPSRAPGSHYIGSRTPWVTSLGEEMPHQQQHTPLVASRALR